MKHHANSNRKKSWVAILINQRDALYKKKINPSRRYYNYKFIFL